MDCQPNSSALSCRWPEAQKDDGGVWRAVNVVAGTYSLQVSAPGYETEATKVEVLYAPAENQCSCAGYVIDPGTVSLVPTDGGTD